MITRSKRIRPHSTDFESKIKILLKKLFQVLLGLFIYSFGVYLTIAANIGLAPWDCLGMGIAKHTPLNYGSSMVLTGVCAIVIQLILRERIGFATLFDALITGRLTQFFIDISPYPENHSLWLGIVFMLFGFLFISLGMYLYMSAEQGCGPKDGLLITIGKRMPKIPIGGVEILLWAVITFAGWLLGGSVGIGTLISVFFGGAVMHLFFDVIGFEPRKMKHKCLTESLARLFKKV